MKYLFDYQIYYYSDSHDLTDLPFSIFSLTQQGLEHRNSSIGNQDSAAIYIGKKNIICSVADGCSTGNNLNRRSYNNISSGIISYLAVRVLRKLVIKKNIPNDKLLHNFENDLFLKLKKILNAFSPWKAEKYYFIKNFLFSTVILLSITKDEYFVASFGD